MTEFQPRNDGSSDSSIHFGMIVVNVMLLQMVMVIMLAMLRIITMVAFDVNRSDSCPSLWTMPFLTLIMALKRLIDWIVIIDYIGDDLH